MSEKLLPGAECAPVIALDLRTGRQRMATEQEIEALRDTAILLRWDAYGPTVAVRRLRCDDPADQREIWRLAALAIGRTDLEALEAVMRPAGACRWSFRVGHGGPVGWVKLPGATCAQATAALCAHVWGPK